MDFKFHKAYDAIVCPEYRAVIHDMRDDEGRQMVVMHLDVDHDKFTPSILKRMKREWACFRQCTDATLFAIENHPDDAKWARFVAIMGFKFLTRVECTDGRSRRCFVSQKQDQ